MYEVTDDIECSPEYEYPRSGSASRLDTMEGDSKKVFDNEKQSNVCLNSIS